MSANVNKTAYINSVQLFEQININKVLFLKIWLFYRCMKKIVYIHGLGGGTNSRTPNVLKEVIGDQYEIIHPELPIAPLQGFAKAKDVIEREQPDLVIGSSLGGFFAMGLPGPYKTILVNPAMDAPNDISGSTIGFGRHYIDEGKRIDDAKYIDIDNDFINQLREIKKLIKYENIDNVYGVFGDKDELLSHIEDFKHYYNENNMLILAGEKHSLSNSAIKSYLIPLAKKLLK